jgi:hypothetical protein
MTPQVLAEKLAPLAPVILPGTFACACGARVLIPLPPRSTIVQCLACGMIHDLRAIGAQAAQGTPPAAQAAPAGAEGRARTARFEEPSATPTAPSRPAEPPRENNPFGITFDRNGSPVFPPKIRCPHCASEIAVPRGFMGSRGPCPKCRMMIVFFER